MTTGSGEYAYVQRLLAEHRRLERLIHHTLAAVVEPTAGQWLPCLLEGLLAIRQEVAQHFHEEEIGGCLEEAVAHCPRLSHDLKQAEKEQCELLANFDDLIAHVRQ